MVEIAPSRRYVSSLVSNNANVLMGVIILTSVVDSLTLGYDGSLMGSLNVMSSYKSYIAPTTALISLNGSITYVGGICSAFISSAVINWRGRKWGMLIAAIIQIIGAALQGGAVNVGMFIVGRFFIGAGSGFSAVAAPTYVAETSRPEWRAFTLGMYYTCWAVGTLIASGVCYGTENINNNWAWRAPSLLQALPSIFCIIILVFIPESPRWLAYQDRDEDCLEVLSVVNGLPADHPIVQLQYREVKETIDFEKTSGATLGAKELIKNHGNRKRLFVSASVAPLVMLTGSNIITFYFGTMLTDAGISDASTQLQINVILSAWQLVCGVIGSMLAERIGRKWLAAGSTIVATIFLYMLGKLPRGVLKYRTDCFTGGLTAAYGTSNNQSGVYGTVACIFLFLGAYSFGLTPLTVIYPPEVLSYSMRASGMGVYTILAKTCGIFVVSFPLTNAKLFTADFHVQTWVFPYMFDAIGWKTYIVNASWNLLFVLLIVFYWVETKDLTLEEIDERFDGVKHAGVPNLELWKRGKADLEEDAVITEQVILTKM
ncbi:Lactose permease [Lachnellula occidentalis]|uniref:Lactose permease n=1 Tax=Lachnellula occidentalis TaxID=215460 RepID=A0A8H8RW57_9HELO|nr:Lactose permease [Lachnellula occidentalis]